MTTAISPAPAAPSTHAYWKQAVAPYAKPHVGKSLLDIATSIVPYLVIATAMALMLRADVSYWWVLLLSVPAAGFLLRTFILFHDCTHGSFLPSKRANEWVGSVLALFVFSPFAAWRHEHAVHHATAGDLDRRGTGDVETLTVAEYYALGRGGRFAYRAFRNPGVMFGVGWIWAMLISTRLVNKDMRPRIKRSIWVMNVALAVVIVGVCMLIGVGDFLRVELPITALAGATGVFMFYVQHQFEDVYWESADQWSYADAALRGSSYLKLPKLLQWFTGNIGLHHVHHLSARIPNYNLERAHNELEIFRDVPVLTFWDGVKASRLKVWDPEQGKLLTWAEAKAWQQQHA